jgi:hypothetical protein
MIDKIVISKDRTRATIYFTNRGPVNLYSDQGTVLVLVDIIITPIGFRSYSEYSQRVKSSQDDTQIVNIKDIA